MKNPIAKRRETFFGLNSYLAQFDNKQLHRLIGEDEYQVVKFDKTKVFVKRVPVTDIGFANMFSTATMYGLPTYYNYGVGFSARSFRISKRPIRC